MYHPIQFTSIARNALLLATASFVLASCGIAGSTKIDLSTNNSNIHDAIEAGTGPLQDLNIHRQEIPDLLKQAAAAPYAHKEHVRCVDIATEVDQLDALLGPDIKPQNIEMASADSSIIGALKTNVTGMEDMEIPTTESLLTSALESGEHAAHDAVMDVIHSHTNILPFRSIIRRVSGANRHQKQLEQAYQAGKLRRAYLKGLADMHFGPKCLAKPIVIEADAAAMTTTASAAVVATAK